MTNPIGPLGPADEALHHQITDTFALVSQTDPSWTEKVCAMACAADGSLQLGFGLGRYPNRNVLDAYAGVSRGVEQWTVRASRALAPDADGTTVGPIAYEVVEPLRTVRFVCAPNDVVPIAYDWTFTAAVPAQLEERTHRRSASGLRVDSDLCRYHQIGTAEGWVELDGERTELDPEVWTSTRDHSWGVRYDVGIPPVDVDPTDPLEGLAFLMFWCPSLLTRPDGTHYGLFFHLIQVEAPGFQHRQVTGGIEHPDGRVEPIVDVVADVGFDPDNRRLRSGEVRLTMEDGTVRTVGLEVVSDTGFQLGAGLYFGWKGFHHGSWRGPLHVDGEHLADCSDPTLVRELHQIRDTVVRITDPVGGGTGIGNCQPVAVGALTAYGLDEASSFW